MTLGIYGRPKTAIGISALLLSTTALWSGAAFAQAAPTDTGTTGNVETVVVTAEKRAVNIQSVPASVSAIQGDELTKLGLKDLQDYANYVPGLEIHDTGSPGQGSVTLRGISSGLGGQGSLIGYYIDDTPMGSSGNYADASEFSLDLLPYDLQRLEVLRGPQGTLYGAGSMGGLIKYVLNQADPSGFTAQAGAEVSSIDHSGEPSYAFRGAVNVPVSDTVAFRVSGFDQVDQGYTNDVRLGLTDVNENRQYGGRAAITWLASPDITVHLNAIWYRQNSDDNNNVRLDDLVKYTDGKGTVWYSGTPVLGAYSQTDYFRQPFSKDIDYYSGSVDWNLHWATLTSATSYSQTTTRQPTDRGDSYSLAPGALLGYLNYDFGLDKFTQELRLASPTGDTIEWLVGGYYTHENSSFNQNLYELPVGGPYDTSGPGFENVSLPLSYKEYAAFGDLTVHITDKFDVTGGVRYSHNDQSFDESVYYPSIPLNLGNKADFGQSDVTWQGNARYHFSDDTMGYVRVASGYRPGGPNVSVVGANPPPAMSDTLISTEVGLKSTFLDGKALIDVSAFNIEWAKFQTNVTVAGQSYLGNAGHAYSRGFEAEGSYSPFDGFRIGYEAAYTKAEITSAGPSAFLTGYQLPGVPLFSGGVNAQYIWQVFGDWQGDVGASLHYTGAEINDAPTTTSLNTRDPAYSRVDLRAGIENDRFDINLYVHNLFDHTAYLEQGAVANAILAPTTPLYMSAFVLQPRTIGLSIDTKF
jgi:outer membrane receptor protein involved in Fe transport